eukprot:Sspe_Gene.5801::Locus_1928_Transcript_1_1_Confidence_1.000_Length_1643::g.5801::m.5801/K03259/EIF4E; translation initiation factor 4E
MSYWDATQDLVVAESTRAYTARHQQARLDRWTFSIEKRSQHDRMATLQEIGSFSTHKDFWAFFNNTPINQLGCGTSLHLFKGHSEPRREHPSNIGGGRFQLVSTGGCLAEPGKAWLNISLALVGSQLSAINQVNGATVCMREQGAHIDVWVTLTQEPQFNTLREQLFHILSQTEKSPWVEFEAHPFTQPLQPVHNHVPHMHHQPIQIHPMTTPAVMSLQQAPNLPQPITIQQPPVQQQSPPMKRRAGPPSHRKSHSAPQQVSQSFLDAAVKEREVRNAGWSKSRTDLSKDSYISPTPLTTTSTPAPVKKDQVAPSFVHKGMMYPQGLSRKQRRAIVYSGRQGHDDVALPDGIYVGNAVEDGQITEEKFEELKRRAAAGEFDDASSQGTREIETPHCTPLTSMQKLGSSSESFVQETSRKTSLVESDDEVPAELRSLGNIGNWADLSDTD